MLKYSTKKVIDSNDWDDLVRETYGKIYTLQQQDGCMDRGNINITIPLEGYVDGYNDSIPEKVNGNQMGVKFEKWLERDIKQPVGDIGDDFMISLFWERNFYPDLQIVANDLYKRGLVEAGKYTINIDW